MSGKKNDFIVQAGILAAAGIISKIIGLLYRSPLYNIVGALGMGYYNSAYNYYSIILMISTYSIPSAMSKVIAQKLAVKEYRNAHRIFLGSIGYVLAVGGVASLALYFGAGLFVSGNAVPVLRTFAPTVFIYGILGVLRGYFQAHESMVQTSVSQILEQISNAAVTIGAAYLLIRGQMGSLEMPADEAGQVKRAVYGAIGSATGTGAGVVVALLFMAAVYGMNRGIIKKRIAIDKHKNTESYGDALKMITMVVTPFILSSAVLNMSSVVNNSLYLKLLPARKELDELALNARWGVFQTQPVTISNIPTAFAMAMAAAMIPVVAQLIASADYAGAREKIGLSIKTTMIISIPCAVGLFVLARPVTGLLFRNTAEEEDLATGLLMALALSIIFYALSTLTSQILQGLGKVSIPIVNAGVALALQTATAALLLLFTELDLYAIVIANTLYAGSICVLNQIAVRRAVGYRQEIVKTFLIPGLASACMGGVAWAVYEGLLMLTSSPRISVVIAICVAACVYFVMLLLFRGLSEDELRGFPKGYLLVKLAKKCRLMK
ncbi:putative polysaccharide biosynthesis protein [Acetatifactor aquisgranensis]|uniref:putative polysaccharide biosynthesis protein n=1 Tax=Acetatifactor aquisgranensis TaxID=2941233 RepID=UPI00203D86C1|nr:polysaccharide biosynthesis protein [Acetatifactor aquisgranensis]MCI8542610.1 polysaccharide biosynthesis protein [Lachnospiraceae bacterium]